MTPYYSDDAITIYHGDCRDILPVHANATITDPPYGTAHYATDVDVFDHLLFLGLPRPLAVFGWPERLVRLCVATQSEPDEWVTWWPTNGALRGYNFAGLWRESEAIAVFGKGQWRRLRQPRTAASARILDANYTLGPLSRGDTNGDPASRQCGDVWTDAAPGLAFQSHLRLHPNEKPVALLTRLVDALTESNAVVLDPFMGSGTTLRAAKDLGRKAIGIEIEERYCEIAARRMGQEVLAL